MSSEDYYFEDFWESYDREWEDDNCYSSYTYVSKASMDRHCTKCENEFKSAYPSSCPKCGGWTEVGKSEEENYDRLD